MKNKISFVALSFLSLFVCMHVNAYYTLENKKDYESLLAKPAFYQSTTTRVRNLKRLAARMILDLEADLAAQMALEVTPERAMLMGIDIKQKARNEDTIYPALTSTQKKGLYNLAEFAQYVLDQLRTSELVESAKGYAIEPIVKDTPSVLNNLRARFSIKGMLNIYFYDFNSRYTPLIYAITETNQKQTRFPRAISPEILEFWASHGGYAELNL